MRNKDLKALKEFTKLMQVNACETHITIRPGGVYDLKVVGIGCSFSSINRGTRLKKIIKKAYKDFSDYTAKK